MCLICIIYRRELQVIQDETIPRPGAAKTTTGAENATGLGLTYENPNERKSLGTRSADYFDKKALLVKTNRFLNYDQRVLRFKCIETTEGRTVSIAEKMIGSGKQYAISYYLYDDSVEVRTLKTSRGSADDATLLLKKNKLPKNWRQVSSAGATLYYYDASDFIIGNVIDCFGRMLLITGCDESTKNYYAEKGIEQHDIEIVPPPEVKYTRDIPKFGDGSLPIGSDQDSLHSVFGHPKPSKNWKKILRNRGIVIRCKTKLLANDQIGSSRVFTLTFYLEDDTVGVFEEVRRNSGIVGGNFLKRGVYMNSLPPDGNEPRPFVATDIYLGNVISLNGYEMQITEMDDMSVRFCEENCDEFPFFDTFQIINHLMGRVSSSYMQLCG
jgi:hypothetical protein